MDCSGHAPRLGIWMTRTGWTDDQRAMAGALASPFHVRESQIGQVSHANPRTIVRAADGVADRRRVRSPADRPAKAVAYVIRTARQARHSRNRVSVCHVAMSQRMLVGVSVNARAMSRS